MNGTPSFGSNQQNQPGEQKFGAPPTPEVNIRTQESDTKSVERGESMPLPESVLPPENVKEPEFKPETQVPEGAVPIEEEQPGGPGGKKPWLWIILGAAIIGLAVFAYFIVYPLISPAPTSISSPSPSPTAQVIVAAPHSSFFLTLLPNQAKINLQNLLHSTIDNNLDLIAANRLPSNTLQEVIIADSNDSQVSFSSYLAAYLPTLSGSQLSSWFEDDFTAFLFYDANGVWPGYAAKIKNGVNVDETRAALSVIEVSDLSKFYLAPPGVFGQFNNGQINGKPTRYAVGGVPGAALNYGFINSYFIVSTSYDGLKAAAPLLGI